MAETTAIMVPAAGRQVAVLGATINADAKFPVQPTEGDQIEADDSLVIGNLPITGPDGTYDVKHHRLDGTVYVVSYQIEGVAPNVTNLTVTPTGVSTAHVSVTASESGTLFYLLSQNSSEGIPAVTAASSRPVAASGDQFFNLSGVSDGDYLHIVLRDSQGNNSGVLTSAQLSMAMVQTTAIIVPEATQTLAVIGSGYSSYAIQDWSPLPNVTGWQFLTNTDEAVIDAALNVTVFVERNDIPLRILELDGTTGLYVIDSTGLIAAADGIPDAPSFNDLAGLPQGVTRESNVYTVTGADAGVDIDVAISSSNGLGEYAVSTDSGASWGGWTQAATTVQVGYQIKLQNDTANAAATGVDTTLTLAGTVSDTWTLTTAAATGDTTPPVLTLLGGDVTIEQGADYVEPGYTATDDQAGDLTNVVQVSGSVNNMAAGQYTLTYSVSDGTNTTTDTRTVTVTAKSGVLRVDTDNVVTPAQTFNIAMNIPALQPGEGIRARITYQGTPYWLTVISYQSGTLTVTAPANLPVFAAGQGTLLVEVADMAA